jgi:hypothetical protein
VIIEKIPTEMQVADIGCSYKGAANFITLKVYLMNCARVHHDSNHIPIWQVIG